MQIFFNKKDRIDMRCNFFMLVRITSYSLQSAHL